ncbi:hypothetical protein GH714_022379 [Hevea brasiliensis]|uniref:Protein NIM1-INTERACTING 1-like n=1 Tax=Hevea brasiliensis TaxID=3981 RepID=A0A6A6NIK6_HEVBR|nr:hypothetical protein GH714_022379 [Hevea brasiliensis]
MENEKVDRAMASVYNDEDDEQEEQKVEKFFALIRGFQEARNNRRKDQVLEEEERKKKVKRLNDSQPSSSWDVKPLDASEEVSQDSQQPVHEYQIALDLQKKNNQQLVGQRVVEGNGTCCSSVVGTNGERLEDVKASCKSASDGGVSSISKGDDCEWFVSRTVGDDE